METFLASKYQSWLTWFMRGLVVLAFFLLVARLGDLQLIKGSYFKMLAEGNRIRRVTITAPRGKVLARGGEVIISNREIKKRVIFSPEEGYSKTEDISDTREDELINEWARDYVEGPGFAHITGYLGEVKESELGRIAAECLEKGPRILGSLVGRGGIEEQYDCDLRGINGEELVEVDAMGNKIRTLGRKQPIRGQDIKTTIDYGLQKKVVELVKEKKGAVVATDINGEVLSLYSSPSFDPNVFTGKSNPNKVNSLLQDVNYPLFDRVIGGKYHPGSIYKPIVAIASLQEGVVDKDYVYDDKGVITLNTSYGTFNYSNWYFAQYGGVEGEIDLVRAIKRSTDTFFYKTGELLGIDKLVNWSRKFGLDKQTEVDLPGEAAGLVPSPEWKIETKGERWFLGNTYHMSIGQGDIALTPIGIHTAISVIANNGRLCVPHLLLDEGSESYKLKTTNDKCRDLGIDRKSIDLVKQGMTEVCRAGGTGYTFFDFAEKSGGIDVVCKTGTAEVDESTKDTHAWFTVFAPGDEPEIIVTVLVEKGGEGSRVAGPIAREIFNYWFGIKDQKLKN